MKPIRDVLWEFTQRHGVVVKPEESYDLFHSRIPPADAGHLRSFLYANMDELRLHHAEKYADAILKISDHDDAMYFRHGVLRRELSGDMDYDRQRDHASHTLNNYLFGWYLASKSSLCQKNSLKVSSRVLLLKVRNIIGRKCSTTLGIFGQFQVYFMMWDIFSREGFDHWTVMHQSVKRKKGPNTHRIFLARSFGSKWDITP